MNDLKRKEYLLTTKESAELLGISERAVRKNAMKGNYGELRYSETMTRCRGGRMIMIRLDCLPEKAQSEYMRIHSLVDEPERIEATDYDVTNEDARREANRKYKIIKDYEAFVAVPGKKTELTRMFLKEWNAGHSDQQLSKSTLYNWQKQFKTNGLAGLLPEYGKRSGQRAIDAAAWEFFQGQYLQLTQPSIGYCYQLLAVKAVESGWNIPSESTIARMVKEDIPDAIKRLKRLGEKNYYDNSQTFTRRDPESISAGEVFVGDHHVLDLFINVGSVEKPKWVRPWMTAWLDMRSRKFVGWTVNLSPRTDEIIAAFANAALDPAIGLPRHIYIDNGRDYCSAKFAGRGNRGKRLTEEDKQALYEEGKITATLMERLKIKTHWAIVENARAKVIERAFKEVVEKFSKFFPTYCGRCQDERPDDLEEKLKRPDKYGMGLEEFSHIFGDWIRNVFNKMVSQGKGRQGECPDQTYMRTRLPVRTADPDVMRLFFMKSTNPFKIGRNGIAFRGHEYYSPDMILHKGKHVYIRYRDEEPDKVWLYSTKDEYLGEAMRIEAMPAIDADQEILAEEQARKARERKALQEHPSYKAAQEAKPLTPMDITELMKLYGKPADDVEPSKVVEMVTLPRAGREAVNAMQATGTDDINPFAAMSAAKIEKRRGF